MHLLDAVLLMDCISMRCDNFIYLLSRIQRLLCNYESTVA